MGVMGEERFAFLGFASKWLFLFFFAYLCQLLKNLFKAHDCFHHSICSNHVTSTFNSMFLLNSTCHVVTTSKTVGQTVKFSGTLFHHNSYMYRGIYFDRDKSPSIVPQSKCILN